LKKQDEEIEELTSGDKKNKRVKNFEDNQSFNMEISCMLLCPWICYLIAEGTGLSGIVAILTNGIVLN